MDRGDDGAARLTDMGDEHVGFVTRYMQVIGEQAAPLSQDASRLDPARSTYSPFGIAYGFCADILSNIAIGALHGQPSFDLALEDMFVSHGNLEHKRLRAEGWERLPKHPGEREHFEHSIEWAALMFQRTHHALDARATHKTAPNSSSVRSGRLFVIPESRTTASLPDGAVAAQEHCVTSDLQRALATGATAFPRSQSAVKERCRRFNRDHRGRQFESIT